MIILCSSTAHKGRVFDIARLYKTLCSMPILLLQARRKMSLKKDDRRGGW